MTSQFSVDYTPNGIAIQIVCKSSAMRITMTLNEAFIHTADDNAPSDLLEEAISEKLDSAITSNLQSDGETPEYDASIVNTPTGFQPIDSPNPSSDEVTITKTLASGAIETRVATIAELKAQGFTDTQISTGVSGIEGVTFTQGGA